MPVKKKKKIIKKAAKKSSALKPIGTVTHFYGGIKVGIFKFNKPMKAGSAVHIKGATTDFKTKIKSMQFNYKEVKVAPKGKQIGIKLGKRVRVGDKVFEA